MKRQMIKTNLNPVFWVAVWTLCVLCTGVQAADANQAKTVKEKNNTAVSKPIITNPKANYGIKVGDQLTRKISLNVPAPYQLTKKSLPKKGSQFKGIELVKVVMNEDQQGKTNHYQLTMVYQVFVNPGVPTAMQLPKIDIALKGGDEAPVVSVPNWLFWFAPLAVSDHENARKAIQADIKPPLLDANTHKNRLIALLVAAGLALIALLYMNAEGHWLPLMGGAFSQAHRQLKKLARNKQAKTQKEEKQALVYMHQAFNRHYGANIFARDIEHFITMKPGFAKMKNEIKDFFDFSNKSLYDTKPRDSEQVIANLVVLSKALRDCERGV